MESSDDEDETPPRISWPPLKLHEKEQAEGQMQESHAKRHGDPVPRTWMIYRNLRFYESLIGFHKGDLDLSGRHQERYVKLKAAWDEYLLDFQVLQPTATRFVTKVDLGFSGRFFEDEGYTFSDLTLWEGFCKKWHIQPFFGIRVFQWTDQVLDTMRAFPEPKIQSLCFQHLPIELIQQVYQILDQAQARSLSSTSRYMRSLALPYIFGSRTVQYEPDSTWHKFSERGIESREDAFQWLQANATAGRDKYIGTLNFVLSRPDLIQGLTSLALLSFWRVTQFDGSLAEGFLPTMLDPDFHAPVHQIHYRFLQATTNLTELRISGLEITIDFVRVTAKLPSLYTIDAMHCSLASDLQAAALQVDFPKYELVINLHIKFNERTDGDNDVDTWYLLPLCPNLQTLSVGGRFSIFGIVLPPEELWDAFMPFKTLHRFSILGLVAWEVSALGGWIRRASGVEGHHIPMTHFKLQSKGKYSHTEIIILANALSYAPDLDVCVFEGIRDDSAQPALITLISQFLPNISALTIIASQVWPSPMWTYGSRFSSFIRLQYFGWNNRFEPEVLPTQMIFMEDGYPDDEGSWLRMHELNRDSDIWDFDRTAAVFGASCPSLKFVGLYIRQVLGAVCSIDRTERGLEIETHEFGSQMVYAGMGTWNTPLIKEWWHRAQPRA